MWVQHILLCADAGSITTEEVHSDCTVILCEAASEPGWDDGGIAWSSHAPSSGYIPDPDHPGVVLTTEERLNPTLGDAEDWR